jgi:predicted ATPase
MPSPGSSASELSKNGSNLAAVLHLLEKNEDIQYEILEWMTFLVPGLTNVTTKEEDKERKLVFEEEHLEVTLPARLVSDGTAYILGLLVAIYHQLEHGICLIEEPERGIHPQAIMELVTMMRSATEKSNRFIWVTTHNTSLVRKTKNRELWLVNKKDGRTVIKMASDLEENSIPKDEAWLCNWFNGGLPW